MSSPAILRGHLRERIAFRSSRSPYRTATQANDLTRKWGVSEGLRPLFLPGTPVPLTARKGVPYSRKRVEISRDGCRYYEVWTRDSQ
jgi:hypothetical protein